MIILTPEVWMCLFLNCAKKLKKTILIFRLLMLEVMVIS